jgi:hypothetical protein
MSGPTHVTVRVPMRIKRRAGRKTIVTPVIDGLAAPTATRADPTLLKALARAFRYQRMLDEGRYASISEMAAAEKIERGYLGSLLRLTLLAPDVVEVSCTLFLWTPICLKRDLNDDVQHEEDRSSFSR